MRSHEAKKKKKKKKEKQVSSVTARQSPFLSAKLRVVSRRGINHAEQYGKTITILFMDG